MSSSLIFRKLFLFGNTRQDGHFRNLSEFMEVLRGRGFEIDIERGFGRYLDESGVDISGCTLVEALPASADAIVSIGGDGTFLHAAEYAGDSEVPILGINTGHLGFLASYTLDEAAMLADMLLGGGARLEHRLVLRLESTSLPEGFRPYALNEVALLKEDTSSMINVLAEIDGYKLADYLADGLVISTPTGSTAYSLAAGGPIVQPTLDCVTLTPVAPHTLTLRPLVVGADSDITLRVTSRSATCRVSLDGRSFVIPCGTTLRVCRAGFSVIVMRGPKDDFASILRNKLLWGRR